MTQPQLQVLEIDHINQLLPDTDEALEFYERVYGADDFRVFRKHFGPYDNFVFKLGSMTVEIFTPGDPEHSFGKQFTRYGPNWQAVLWRVPNLEECIETFQARDIALVDIELDPDRRWAFTDPRATYFSIQLEDRDEWDKTVVPTDVGAEKMIGFTAAVKDAEEAARFFTGLIANADIVYEEDRPKLNATAVGVKLGDSDYTMELLSPTSDGPISEFIDKNKVRIRTATFKVQSLDDLQKRFESHGVKLVDGDREGYMATDPATHLGVMMQFTE
jgi:catechol 2,3-dioxygenase-like lactoylglutathione lyase family enzyme